MFCDGLFPLVACQVYARALLQLLVPTFCAFGHSSMLSLLGSLVVLHTICVSELETKGIITSIGVPATCLQGGGGQYTMLSRLQNRQNAGDRTMQTAMREINVVIDRMRLTDAVKTSAYEVFKDVSWQLSFLLAAHLHQFLCCHHPRAF